MKEQMNFHELNGLRINTTRGKWQVSMETTGSNDIVHNICRVRNEFGDIIADGCSAIDARFIVEAHSMVPALLSRIYELEAQNEQIKQRVKECARLFHEYTEIVHRMEVIQNETQSTTQAKKKKPRRRNRSCYR